MSYTIINPSSHDEWLKHRESGIGSSEVGTILGINPYETPYQLWRRKVGIDPPVQQNFAMKAGHYLEDAVSKFFEDETGYLVDQGSAGDWIVVSDAKPYLRVSPDRIYSPKRDLDKRILECKTTQMDIEKDDVPQHWFAQLQYQLGVCELNRGSLAWLIAGRKFDYREYTFDDDFFGWMVSEVDRFWVDNILGGQEPEAVNVDDVLLRNPRHVDGKKVVATDALLADCAALKEIKDELSAIETRKRELESAIKMAMGDAEALVSPDSTPADPIVLATWKAAKDSVKFDEKAFAAAHPDIYQNYLKTITGSRRFLLK